MPFSLTHCPFIKWREANKASPPALCFPRFAGFTNSDLWFSEERGEWLVMEMEEVILGLIRGGDVVDDEG